MKHPMRPAPAICSTLPEEAVLMLRRAASTQIPPGDRMARTKAIDRAIQAVRLKYPQFFKAHDQDTSS